MSEPDEPRGILSHIAENVTTIAGPPTAEELADMLDKIERHFRGEVPVRYVSPDELRRKHAL